MKPTSTDTSYAAVQEATNSATLATDRTRPQSIRHTANEIPKAKPLYSRNTDSLTNDSTRNVDIAVTNPASAIGKAILAALPEEDVRLIAQRTGLPRRMPRTLTTPEALLANLATVRARGWALDDEENATRVRCIGAVVLDHRGEPIGAVSVSGLSVDLGRVQVARLAPMVVRTAREVSAALGARGARPA